MITPEQIQAVIDAIDKKHHQKIAAEFNQVARKLAEVLPPDQTAELLARHFLEFLDQEKQSGVLVAVHKVGTVAVEAYVTSKSSITWH